jgi:hypothetical protein
VKQDCVPNFFVVGAAKCGTTSLHAYLQEHPQIAMTSAKEPCVYSNPRGLPSHPGYEGLFDDCRAQRRGESSTSYSRWPAEGDAAARIRAAVPDARLIYLVRDPIERLVSDYVQQVAVGFEERPIDEALADFADPGNWYVCASRYGMQADHYLEHFDRSALLIVEQSELRNSRSATLRRVFEFLGVDPDFDSPAFRPELASREDHLRYRGLGWRLRMSALGRAYRRLPVRARLPISRAARRPFRSVPRPTVDPRLRAELAEFLAPDVERIRALSGRSLAHWGQAPAAAPSRG